MARRSKKTTCRPTKLRNQPPKDNQRDVPDNFLCPLSGAIMTDPVLLTLTCERSEFEKWLQSGKTSFTVTKEALANTDVTTNEKKRVEIREWCERNNKSDVIRTDNADKVEEPISTPKDKQSDDVAVSDHSKLCISQAEEPKINLQADSADKVWEPISPAKDQQWDDVSVQDKFLCPLSGTIMIDPVLLSNGQSCERSAFKIWLKSGKRSFRGTNEALANTNVMPEDKKRVEIREWCKRNNIADLFQTDTADKVEEPISTPKNKQSNDVAVPNNFLCPLSVAIVIDPVPSKILLSNGHYKLSSDKTEVHETNSYALAMAKEAADPKIIIPGDEPRCVFEAYVMHSYFLPLPYEDAEIHFPIHPFVYPLMEYRLELTDPTAYPWSLDYVQFTAEQAFILVCGWYEYMKRFNLRAGDKIRFFIPSPRRGPTHFRTEHLYRPVNAPPFITNFEFIPEKFLFENEITDFDEMERILMVNRVWARALFPFLHTREGGQQIVKFTDKGNRDWYMIIQYEEETDEYLLYKGWRSFVEEYDLEAGDMIRFYEPNLDTLNYYHFLIEFRRHG